MTARMTTGHIRIGAHTHVEEIRDDARELEKLKKDVMDTRTSVRHTEAQLKEKLECLRQFESRLIRMTADAMKLQKGKRPEQLIDEPPPADGYNQKREELQQLTVRRWELHADMAEKEVQVLRKERHKERVTGLKKVIRPFFMTAVVIKP